jgi:hypothetical protein
MVRYLLTLASLVVTALLFVFILNCVVDPMAMNVMTYPGWFPHDYRYEREVRYNILSALRPDVLILGASQAEVGLDPADPVLGGTRPYNGAIAGGTLSEIEKLERHAASLGSVKRATILVPDYFMARTPQTLRYNEVFLAEGGWIGLLRSIEARTSLAMLVSTIKEIAEVLGYGRSYLYPTGQMRPDELEAQMRARGGQRGNFDYSIARLVESLRYEGKDFGTRIASIIDVACQHGMNMTILIPPDHVYYLLVVRALGQWKEYVGWLRTMQQTAAVARCPVKVWDFTLVNPVTTEAVPPAGSPKRMSYYYDAVHFRSNIGPAMLERALNGKSEDANDVGAFTGTLLTRDSFESTVERLETALRIYEETHPAEVAQLVELILSRGTK